MSYWILKTEPNCYSFDNLLRDKTTHWDGVRNYQARNNLAAMKKGDQCMIYHSCGPKELVGIAKVAKEAYPDPTIGDPRWLAVDIVPTKALARPVHLEELKHHPELRNLSLVKQGRLSVCPVSDVEWELLQALSLQ